MLDGAGAEFSSLAPLTGIAAGGSLEILDGGSFTTAGDLDNAGTIDLAAGTLNVAGNYTQETTGAYDVAIGGLVPGSLYGQLNVTSQATLAGALSVSLLNGYDPPPGDSYRILNFDSRVGDFDAEFGLHLGDGTGFSPIYNTAPSPGLDLTVISESPGTLTTVQSSENPSKYGDSVTFTVTVTPAVSTDLIATGTVTFYDGSTVIDTETLCDGAASFTTSALVAGMHSIVAQYNGDSNFSGSNSTVLTQTVNPLSLVVATQPPAGVLAGNAFGFTVDVLDSQDQIDSSYDGTLTVSFANNPGASVLGGSATAPVVNGVATFSGLTISNPGLAYALQVSATGVGSVTTANFDVAGYQLVASGASENLVWYGTSGSDQVQFAQTAAGTVQITVSELGGLAFSFTGTVTGVTGDVVVNEYDVAGDADVVDGSGLTTIPSCDHRG